jgi:hypothetical protein
MKRVATAAGLAISLLGAGASIAPANAHPRCPPGDTWTQIITRARADGKVVYKHHWGCMDLPGLHPPYNATASEQREAAEIVASVKRPPHCTHGKLCGNTCIARGKVCHVPDIVPSPAQRLGQPP